MTPLQMESLHTTALAMFDTSRNLFWTCLPVLVLLAFVTLYMTGNISGEAFARLFKRVVIAAILLYALPTISETFVEIENYLVSAFGGEESLHSIFVKVSTHIHDTKTEATSNWFKIGQLGLTVFSTLSFIILSVVYHFLNVLHISLWNLLNIMGPLALLGCVFPSFTKMAQGIFYGMLELSLWRPFWVILGRILIAIGFGDSPSDPSQWVDVAIMNFAVAALMAGTPLIVHHFLSGSLASIGGGAVQTMIGGAGQLLARMPARVLESAIGGTKRLVGAAGGAAWAATTGVPPPQSRPHLNRGKISVPQNQNSQK
jgi:hypothetical protein